MKCKYCGNNLTIDDDKCPFCGQTNTYAEKHRKQMHYFKGRFSKTEKNVLETSRRFNVFTVKVTVIAVLVALNVTVLLLLANEYELRRLLIRRDIKKNMKEYEETIKEYEEDGNYLMLGKYFRRKKLSYHERFNEYEVIGEACDTYGNAYNLMMQIQTTEESEYYPREQQVEYLTSSIHNMYSYMEREKYSKDEWFKPEHVEAMNGLKQEMKCLLMTYCNLSKEDADKFPTLSEARQQIMLEEGLGIEN